MKRNVRNSKYDPLVYEVELIHANPQYADVRLPNGQETTVSTKKLAPCGNTPSSDLIDKEQTETLVQEHSLEPLLNNDTTEPAQSILDSRYPGEPSSDVDTVLLEEAPAAVEPVPLRRYPLRDRKKPDRLDL